MTHNYNRYKELRKKATSKFNGRGSLNEQLINAVGEISMMHQHDVPEYKWSDVKAIIDACSTHKAKEDEGYYRASIDKMSYKEQLALKACITSL